MNRRDKRTTNVGGYYTSDRDTPVPVTAEMPTEPATPEAPRLDAADALGAVFRELPASAFPVVFVFVDRAQRVVWEATVNGPGVLRVPPLEQEHGPVRVRVTFADGQSAVWPPGPW